MSLELHNREQNLREAEARHKETDKRLERARSIITTDRDVIRELELQLRADRNIMEASMKELNRFKRTQVRLENLKRNNGWELSTEIDYDHDCRKRCYRAINFSTGEEVTISHSPYELMSPEAFSAHVALGFPPRGSHNWRNETILARLAAKREAA